MPDEKARPATPTFTGALAATVRHDPLVRSALVFFGAVAVAQMLLAGLDESTSAAGLAWLRSRLVPFGELVLLLMVLVGLTWRLNDLDSGQERRFWRRIRIAYCCWLLGAILRLLLVELEPRPFQVVLYAFLYIFMIRALEGEPHRPPRLLTNAMERLMTWPAVTFFVLGIVAYFFFVPLSVHWKDMLEHAAETAASRRDEFYVYTLLDLYLSIRFLVLARVVTSPRWRAIYLASALPWILLVVLTDLSYILAQTSVTWPLASIPSWWAYSGLLAQVVAVRLRHYGFPTRKEPVTSALLRGDELSFLVSARTLALGVIFPVVHVVATRYDLVDTPGHGARQALVLIWLIFFGTVALFQHRYLESRAQALWLERVTLEEDMRASEQDLRLIIERDRASEMVRSSEKKFDLIFASCPSALFVVQLGDGRISEVNDAFEETFGRRRQDVIGISYRDLGLGPEPDVPARLAHAMEQHNDVEEVEVRFRTGDGQERRGLLSAVEIEVEGSLCLLSIVHDVTERRRDLERLESIVRLIEHAQAAIFEVDARGCVRTWNQGAERIAGWKEKEVLGTEARDLLVSAGPADSLLSADDGLWAGEVELVHREGHTVLVNGWSSPVRRNQADSRLVIAVPVT